jgi:hypothetical protein
MIQSIFKYCRFKGSGKNMKGQFFLTHTAIILTSLFFLGISCGQQGKDLPPEVLEFLTDAQIEQLKNHGLTINEGSDPPDVEGAYLTNAELCLYSYDGDTGWTAYPYYYNFTSQNNDTLTVAYNSPSAGDSAAGDRGYISGSGNDFSIFVASNGVTDSNLGSHLIMYTLVTVYSGSIDTDGIHEFMDAFICTHKENDIYDEFMDVNGDRIFREEDALAERLPAWPFSSSSIENTITQFQDASNDQDFASFKATLSPDSDFWIAGDPAIQDFMETYMGTYIPVSFYSLSINQSGTDATVLANADYIGGLLNVNVRFEMRLHDPVWKIRQYWDDSSGSEQYVWLKLWDSILLVE